MAHSFNQHETWSLALERKIIPLNQGVDGRQDMLGCSTRSAVLGSAIDVEGKIEAPGPSTQT